MSEKTKLQVSPVSAWSEGELVRLTSSKVYRLRQIDSLSVMSEEGIPNFLLPLISKATDAKSAQEVKPPSADQLIKLSPLLNRIAAACVVEPALVSTPEEVNADKGIMLSMIQCWTKWRCSPTAWEEQRQSRV